MPTRYYVTAQRMTFPYGTQRLCGPFETFRAASMMEQPLRRAIAGDPAYDAVSVRAGRFTGKRHPPGALDLTAIDLDDVILASIMRR